MKPPATPTLISASAGLHSEAETRLHGDRLLLARMGWIAIFILTLVLFCANLMSGDNDVVTTILVAAATSVWFAVSLMLFWRKSTDANILLMSMGLVLLGGVFFPPYPFALFQWNPVWFWGMLVYFLEFLAWAAFSIFYLFPDGRFVPGFTRWLALGWLFLSFVANVSDVPWYWPFQLLALLRIAFYCSLALAQLYRYRWASTSVQRQQTKWVVFAFTIVIIGFCLTAFVLFLVLGIRGDALGISSHWGSLLNELLGTVAFYLLPVLIPLSIGIALLRYRLWDINLIINRTLVYGVLTVSIVALYTLVVVGLGTLLQAQGNPGLALLATGLIAVLFQPLRTRLQRAVNRLMYGERDEPYAVLSRLGRRLEATLAPEAVLPTIVETVAQALKLPYAAITLKHEQQFALAASYGEPLEAGHGGLSAPQADLPAPQTGFPQGAPLRPSTTPAPKRMEALSRWPLIYQTELVGELVLAPRGHGEVFSPADRRLLDDLARQTGVAAHAVRLTADLQRSRERLVSTREEERRRLRRDLHDGLGPTLAALNLQAGVVRTLITSDPDAADALVAEWRTQLRAAIVDIRRLVYELRPPALDELGLVGAIRERAAQYNTHAEANALQVGVEAQNELPSLPAAVEVAAYRIVQEALANVVRHAQARTCCIRLWVDEGLHLEITDDGMGLPAEHHLGVGLLSMRERAAELGGSCVIEPIVTGGTRVCARLPLPQDAGR